MPNHKSKQRADTLAEQVQSTSEVEQVQSTNEARPLSASRDDYLRARAVIQLYRENQKNRPKRKCSDKQLAALAQGRMKNKRCKKKEDEGSN